MKKLLDSDQSPTNFIETIGEVSFEMVYIKGGTFTIGSPETEVDRRENETQREMEVADFYMGACAVTVAEFAEFVKAKQYQTEAETGGDARTWKHGAGGKERLLEEYNHPVLHVSWNDAQAYCDWLTERIGKPFRLPTEAEWEYACRAGTTSPFSTGDNLSTEQANYDGNHPYNSNDKGIYREDTVPAKYFEPNEWGLYQMHGNVWEWCDSWYVADYKDYPATVGSFCVLRGGSWNARARGCRSAYRGNYTPDRRYGSYGFRLASPFPGSR